MHPVELKTTIGILVLAVIVAFLYVFCGPLVEPRGPRLRIRAENQAGALSSLCALAWIDQTNLFPELEQAISQTNLSNEAVFHAVLKAKANAVFQMYPAWKQQQRFTDPWGNEYQFVVRRQTNGLDKSLTLTVISNGPNGQDDGGSGDDVASRPVALRP